MNPVRLWLLGLGLTLIAAEAESAVPKTATVINTAPAVFETAAGDALQGVQEVVRRRREYPHYLFTPGAPRPAYKTLDALRAEARNNLAAAPFDTLHIAWIRVEFAENSVPGQFTGNGRFDLEPDVSIPVDPPPHNAAYFEAHGKALSRYYHTESYGTLTVESTIFPPGNEAAYLLDDPGTYGPWNVGQDSTVVTRAERFVTEAVLTADAAGGIDFSKIDGVIVVHAGADFQGDVNGDTPYDIPSFTLTFGTPVQTSSGEVPRVSVIPETTSQDDLWGALNGVVAHECGHLFFGLPDLYNIYNGAPQVGWFSLMDSGENLIVVVGDSQGNELYEARGTTPTSLDPWCKLQAFPIAARRLFVGSSDAPFQNGVWESDLGAGITHPDIPMVQASPTEYYLLENRVLDLDGNGGSFTEQDSTTGVFLGPDDDPDLPGQGGRMEYDWPIPGEGGVAIWHIDDALINLGLSVQGGVNLRIGFRGVALEEADGIWDIGYNTGYPFGHPNDLFFVGNNTLFNPFTTPSSETNTGAYSGVSIQVADPPGLMMTVRVQNPLLRPDWPLSVGSGFHLHHMAVTRSTGMPVPVVAYGNEDIEEYGLFAPGTSFGALHDKPLPNPLVTKDDFNFGSGKVGMLTGTIDAEGHLVAWDGEGEMLFQAGAALSGAPRIVADVSAGQDVLLVEADSGVEAYTGAGSLERVWDFDGAPRSSNIAVFPDDTFAVAFLDDVVQFDLSHSAPLQVHTFSQAITRLLIGKSGNDDPRVFAFGVDHAFVLSGSAWMREASWSLPARPLSQSLLLDVDHDGQLEVAMSDTSGGLWVQNIDGSPALGWPRLGEDRWEQLRSGDLDNDGRLDLAAVSSAGEVHGFGGNGQELPTYPRPFASGAATPVWLEPDSGTLLIFGVTDRQMWSWNVAGATAPPGSWPAPWAGPYGGHYLATPAVPAPGGPDLGPAAFLAYPNPTMGSDVELRFHLDSGEDFEIAVVDAAGRRVEAQLDLRGSPKTGENAVQWAVGDVAPGLYYCLLKRTGVGGSRLDKVKVAVLQ